jgi:Domain of unknown function (DUF1905)/Bacteriocin-protection, YdeI or OmpD-Associated
MYRHVCGSAVPAVGSWSRGRRSDCPPHEPRHHHCKPQKDDQADHLAKCTHAELAPNGRCKSGRCHDAFMPNPGGNLPTALRVVGPVVRGYRDYLGVLLPPDSAQVLASTGQATVEGTINGQPFSGLAFPVRGKRHFLCFNSTLRKKLGIGEGQVLEVMLRRRTVPNEIPAPEELLAAFECAPDSRLWWGLLTPGARRIASTWIGQAKSPEVRAWRVRDVLRRAQRSYRGQGPFFPTRADQRLMSRRSAAAGSGQPRAAGARTNGGPISDTDR